MTEKAPKMEKVLLLPDIEKMPEDTLERVRAKEKAYNDFVGYWRERLQYMGDELEGSKNDPLEQAQETAMNFQAKDQVADAVSHASEQMVRLTTLASAMREKTAS